MIRSTSPEPSSSRMSAPARTSPIGRCTSGRSAWESTVAFDLPFDGRAQVDDDARRRAARADRRRRRWRWQGARSGTAVPVRTRAPSLRDVPARVPEVRDPFEGRGAGHGACSVFASHSSSDASSQSGGPYTVRGSGVMTWVSPPVTYSAARRSQCTSRSSASPSSHKPAGRVAVLAQPHLRRDVGRPHHHHLVLVREHLVEAGGLVPVLAHEAAHVRRRPRRGTRAARRAHREDLVHEQRAVDAARRDLLGGRDSRARRRTAGRSRRCATPRPGPTSRRRTPCAA